MITTAIALVALWLGWILLNLLIMIFVRRPDTPNYNGFSIHMPQWLKQKLTPNEYQAVYQHECGHRECNHVWKNFLLVCFFRRASSKVRREQEHQADDFAFDLGYGPELASALRKLAVDNRDFERAQRIEDKYEQLSKSRVASNPDPGRVSIGWKKE